MTQFADKLKALRDEATNIQGHIDLAFGLADYAAEIEALARTSQAVYDRWQTPNWKDAEPTAEAIYRMREALAALDKGNP